jgi:aminopeptidase N
MANICRKVIEYFSSGMPGYPFPYPQLTAFNGLGQMEYPMMINDNTLDNRDDVITLASHEIAHQYLPFYMGTNESRHAWMDEGWATFFEYHASLNAFTLTDSTATFPRYYQTEMNFTDNAELDVPLYTPSNQQMANAYGFNTYGKPAAAYTALKLLLGAELFKKCLHDYFRTWNGRHPQPHDFFNTFNTAAGQNLNWFWKSWFFDYNTVNLSLGQVNTLGDQLVATIVNTGGKPVPVTLEITHNDGSKERVHRPLDVWKTQNEVQISIPAASSITRLRIVQDWFYENDLTDNVWKK